MSLVNANCTNCGGVLQVDSEKEAWICPYCKTPFIVEKGITNYNTTINNNFNIEHANIAMSSNDFKIIGGVLEKYSGESVDVVIPSSVREIAAGAFSGIKISSVKIPSSVETIGRAAFSGCNNLEKIIFEDGVKILDESCFYCCVKLKEIVLPNSLETIGSKGK